MAMSNATTGNSANVDFPLIVLVAKSSEIFATEPDGTDWLVAESREAHLWDALNDASLNSAEFSAEALGAGVPDTGRTNLAGFVTLPRLQSEKMRHRRWHFHAGDLQKICQAETSILSNETFRNDLCWRTQSGNCAFGEQAWASVTFNFYGRPYDAVNDTVDESHRVWECPLLAQNEVDAVLQNWRNALDAGDADGATPQEQGMASGVRFFLGVHGFERVGDDSLKVCQTRSFVMVGTPWAGFGSAADGAKQQRANYNEATQSLEIVLREKYYKDPQPFLTTAYLNPISIGDGDNEIDFYFSNPMQGAEMRTVVNNDLLFVTLSILFVWCWLGNHTRSFVLSALGMMMILIAFPIGIIMNHFVLGVTYFNQMNILVIFLILGIGADDIFVQIDAFKFAKNEMSPLMPGVGKETKFQRMVAALPEMKQRILAGRLHHALERSIEPVFATSITTTIAFVATGLSPITPLRSFGSFAAVTVMTLYIEAITFLPCAIAFVAYYRAGKGKWGTWMSVDSTSQSQLALGDGVTGPPTAPSNVVAKNVAAAAAKTTD